MSVNLNAMSFDPNAEPDLVNLGEQPIPRPPPSPNSLNDEKTTLWRAIYGLGHNFEAFAARQADEAAYHRQAITALINSLPQASATSSLSPGSSGSAPRVREPRMFDGTAQQVDPFVREITNSLFLQRRSFVTSRDKCLYLGFYLKDGSPSAWYTSVEKNHPELLDNYDAFLSAFKKHFEDSDRYATALANLRKLKQAPGSAANYASRFRELAWELSLTDQTAIQMFYDGLKDDVKDALAIALLANTPTKLDEYIKLVITIDNKLYRRKVERRLGPSKPIADDYSPPSTSRTPTPSTPPFPPSSTTLFRPPSPPLLPSNNDVVPMEIDATKHGPLITAELERRRAQGLCNYCGQGKHPIFKCPNMSDAAKRKYHTQIPKA